MKKPLVGSAKVEVDKTIPQNAKERYFHSARMSPTTRTCRGSDPMYPLSWHTVNLTLLYIGRTRYLHCYIGVQLECLV